MCSEEIFQEAFSRVMTPFFYLFLPSFPRLPLSHHRYKTPVQRLHGYTVILHPEHFLPGKIALK
jgi:hypothetical protein